MPLVAHNDLPTFDRLKNEGRLILPPGRAFTQDVRELHIGFLNMMPDAALEAAERQFFRLIGESNKIAQFYMHPFTVPGVPRSAETQSYIEKYYDTFESIKEQGLDALIVTGANEETNPKVTDENFWAPLREVLGWAQENVTSTICSCLASHAALNLHHKLTPGWRETKCWGVYQHKVLDRSHPLVRGTNTKFDVPHSRFSELTRAQFEEAGFKVLAHSEEAGVHCAVSPDGFRLVCLQGHPEYDIFSLLKEYRRDVMWYRDGTLEKEPPFPANYFGPISQGKIKAWLESGEDRAFPEDEIIPLLENTWQDSARTMLANWIGLVYQITHVDRRKPFMEGIDPAAPLKGL